MSPTTATSMSIPPFDFKAKDPYNPLADHPSIIFEDTPSECRGDEERITDSILKIQTLLLNLHQRDELGSFGNDDTSEETPMENLHSTASIYAPCFREIEDTSNDRFRDIASKTRHFTYEQNLKCRHCQNIPVRPAGVD